MKEILLPVHFLLEKEFRHIFRQRRCEFHRLFCDGMEKLKTMGVQSLPADDFHIRIVKIISDQRKSKIFHMDPDLMGTSCF